jgi:hypothetical protein
MNAPQTTQLHKHSVMPSCLQLSLKSKWFEMTKAGIKTEDYRDITPYWCSRLLLSFRGEKMNQNWWKHKGETLQGTPDDIKENIELFTNFRKFKVNIMTLGYPKSTDTDRILKLEHKGIKISTGNPEWGAEPGKLYFVIMHGSTLA